MQHGSLDLSRPLGGIALHTSPHLARLCLPHTHTLPQEGQLPLLHVVHVHIRAPEHWICHQCSWLH